MHFSHEFILCIQITRGRVDFNRDSTVKKTLMTPSFEPLTLRPRSYSICSCTVIIIESCSMKNLPCAPCKMEGRSARMGTPETLLRIHRSSGTDRRWRQSGWWRAAACSSRCSWRWRPAMMLSNLKWESKLLVWKVSLISTLIENNFLWKTKKLNWCEFATVLQISITRSTSSAPLS